LIIIFLFDDSIWFGFIEQSRAVLHVYVFLLLTLINAFEAVACYERYFDRTPFRFQCLTATSGRFKSSIRTRSRILSYMKIIYVRNPWHHTYYHHSLARVRQGQSEVLRVVQSHSFQYVQKYYFYNRTILCVCIIYILLFFILHFYLFANASCGVSLFNDRLLWIFPKT